MISNRVPTKKVDPNHAEAVLKEDSSRPLKKPMSKEKIRAIIVGIVLIFVGVAAAFGTFIHNIVKKNSDISSLNESIAITQESFETSLRDCEKELDKVGSKVFGLGGEKYNLSSDANVILTEKNSVANTKELKQQLEAIKSSEHISGEEVDALREEFNKTNSSVANANAELKKIEGSINTLEGTKKLTKEQKKELERLKGIYTIISNQDAVNAEYMALLNEDITKLEGQVREDLENQLDEKNNIYLPSTETIEAFCKNNLMSAFKNVLTSNNSAKIMNIEKISFVEGKGVEILVNTNRGYIQADFDISGEVLKGANDDKVAQLLLKSIEDEKVTTIKLSNVKTLGYTGEIEIANNKYSTNDVYYSFNRQLDDGNFKYQVNIYVKTENGIILTKSENYASNKILEANEIVKYAIDNSNNIENENSL